MNVSEAVRSCFALNELTQPMLLQMNARLRLFTGQPLKNLVKYAVDHLNYQRPRFRISVIFKFQ